MLVPLEEVRPEMLDQSHTTIKFLSHLANRLLRQKPSLLALKQLPEKLSL
jgi:hypothetical protein